jgi:hypothetical protein
MNGLGIFLRGVYWSAEESAGPWEVVKRLVKDPPRRHHRMESTATLSEHRQRPTRISSDALIERLV